MTTETQEETSVSDTIPVDDLNHFVQLLVTWHTERCAAVQHLLEMPEDAEFTIGDEGEDVKTVTMTKEVLEGFKLGVEMTMMQMGTLPFEVEMEDEPTVQ